MRGRLVAIAVWAGLAIACGSAPARVDRPRPVPVAMPAVAMPARHELEATMDRVRAIVASAHRDGQPGRAIRDPELEAWLRSLVARIHAATGRGRLPFEPGAPRAPNDPGVTSTYTGGERVVSDGDLATFGTRLGSIARSLVLIDGDARIGFVRDSIVIVTGRADVAFSDDSLIVAAGGLSVSHAGRPRHDAGIPDLLISGTTLRISHAWSPIIVAPDGTDASLETGAQVVSLAMELLDSPAIMRDPALAITGTRSSPLERELEAIVEGGPAPRVCVHRAGDPVAIACGVEGEALGGALAGLTIAWSSPRLVVLARGEERIRLIPSVTSSAELTHLALAPATEVHVVGVYEPALPGARVRVEVARRGPVALVLMSHDAVGWDVVAEPGTEIVGVVLAGWELSRVAGLPPGTPVVSRLHALGEPSFSSHEATGDEWARTSPGIAESLGRSGLAMASFTGAEIAPTIVVVR